MRRQRIGIHVEQLTASRRADARDDRHVAAGQQIGQQLRRAVADRRTDQAQIDRCAGHADDRRRALDRRDGRIRAGQSDRLSSRPSDRRDQPRIDRAGEHRDDDVERRRIGHAKAIDLLLRNARGRQRRVDLLAAAMDDDERRPRGETRDRRGDALQILRLLEKLATELQDEALFLPGVFLHSSPVRSSSPSSTLRFCTADPAAPLIRLSITATRTMRPRSASTFQPMSQKFVCATCLISGRAPPVKPDERRVLVRARRARRRPVARSCPASAIRRSSRGCRGRAARDAGRT